MTEDVRAILLHSPRVAVLGAHHEAARAAFYVPDYLHRQGYDVVGVNPVLAGRELWGRPVVATLAEVGEVDLVDVFRRSELLPGHLDELLALHPPAVWFQQGVRHDAVAERLRAAGIAVVQDRCTLADHRRLGLGAPIAAR
jgi:predicted CoA-binding protein